MSGYKMAARRPKSALRKTYGAKASVKTTASKMAHNRPVSTSQLINMVKSVSLKQSETKRTVLVSDNAQLNHNLLTNVVGNLCATSQGSGQYQRLGDEIIGRGISIKVWLSNKSDRPNVMYRLLVYTTQPFGSTSPSFITGSSSNNILGIVDSDKIKVLYQKIIKPLSGDFSLEATSSLKEHSTYHSLYINLKDRKIKYTTDGGSAVLYGNNNINFCIIAYDAYGTLTTDTIASASIQSVLYFKDP